jgi:hypothetical protein
MNADLRLEAGCLNVARLEGLNVGKSAGFWVGVVFQVDPQITLIAPILWGWDNE